MCVCEANWARTEWSSEGAVLSAMLQRKRVRQQGVAATGTERCGWGAKDGTVENVRASVVREYW